MSLVVEDVHKRFGATEVLRGVSLTLAPREFLSLVGPSGCGKTTLLRIIAGLETADRGRVLIDGRDVTTLRPAARDVAMVFQNYALYPHLTVAQNMAVPLAMRRLSALGRLPLLRHLVPGQAALRRGIQRDVRAAAGLLGIDHLLDRRPAQLSGGQRQRVALGRAVVRQPAAFLMDEPLSNLDAALRARTRTEIVGLHRRAGVPTVYVTHDQVEAMTMSDRVALMQAGQILQLGTPRQLYDHPASLAVARFLGSPRINTLEGHVVEGGVVVDGALLPLHGAAAPGTPVIVALRPEALHLHPAGPLGAIVDHVEYLGAELLLHAHAHAHAHAGAGAGAGGDALIARLPAAADLRPGDTVRLTADWATALMFSHDGAALHRVSEPVHV